MMTALQQGGSSSDEASTDDESWKKGKSKAEVAYVMGAAQADQDTDEASVDSTTAKKYLKRFKKKTETQDLRNSTSSDTQM